MDDVAELVDLPRRATPDLPGDLPVDLDLGELAHRPARLVDDRPTTPARRAAFLPPGPRRALVLLALVALLSAVVGWQVGAHRADARSSSTTAPPAVLSWLEDNGSNAHSTVQDPSEDLELHITNLGADPVRVLSVVAHTRQNPVELHLTAMPQAPLAAGRTAEVILVAHAACRSAYPSASLTVRLMVTGQDGGQRTADVPVVQGDGVGASFRDVLNRVCFHPTPDAGSGGIDGVYVQSTFTAQRATLILENHASDARSVTFSARPSPVFDLAPDPPGPTVLPPGQSRSITLQVRVTSCHDLFTLGAWADSAQVEVGRVGSAVPAAGLDPTTYSLKGLLLATMGASVERTCGTPIG